MCWLGVEGGEVVRLGEGRSEAWGDKWSGFELGVVVNFAPQQEPETFGRPPRPSFESFVSCLMSARLPSGGSIRKVEDGERESRARTRLSTTSSRVLTVDRTFGN